MTEKKLVLLVPSILFGVSVRTSIIELRQQLMVLQLMDLVEGKQILEVVTRMLRN